MQLKYHECDNSRGGKQGDCAECMMVQAIGGLAGAGGLSSQGDSEQLQNSYRDTNSQYYRSQMQEMRDHINHLETVKSKLVPDLEKYEAEINNQMERRTAMS